MVLMKEEYVMLYYYYILLQHSHPIKIVLNEIFFFPEVNIMWAAHQAHHSSEDYNLTTALRQSVVQNYSSAVSISS